MMVRILWTDEIEYKENHTKTLTPNQNFRGGSGNKTKYLYGFQCGPFYLFYCLVSNIIDR